MNVMPSKRRRTADATSRGTAERVAENQPKQTKGKCNERNYQ